MGGLNDRDPEKLVSVIDSNQRNIAHEASVDKEANEFTEVGIVVISGLANHVTRDRIVMERHAKDVQSRAFVAAIKITQSHDINRSHRLTQIRYRWISCLVDLRSAQSVDRKRAVRELVSTRLELRPIRKEEGLALYRIWIDEEVCRFLWDGMVVPLEETKAIVDRSSRLFEERGYGLWGVREFGCDELVGFAGYWHFRTTSSLELLFGVKSGRWNRGIATESGRSVIRYGFETLNFPAVEASTDAGNAASIRVLEKLGMSLRQRAVVDGLDTLFYTLARSDYDAARDIRSTDNTDSTDDLSESVKICAICG